MLISQISATLLSLGKIASLWERGRLEWLSFPPLQDCQSGKEKTNFLSQFHLLLFSDNFQACKLCTCFRKGKYFRFSHLLMIVINMTQIQIQVTGLQTKLKRKIFQKGIGRNNFLARMMPLPPPLITLDRSDGVQTTAAFPSHPTWGPGIPIAWSQAGEHTLPSCTTSTLATASKKRASPRRLQYKTHIQCINCTTV